MPQLGLLLAALLTADPATVDVRLTAELLLHDEARGRTTAEGRATLTTDGAAVDADRILYDREKKTVTAAGHVVARLAAHGLVAILADVVVLTLDGQEVNEIAFLDGHAETKKGVAAATFLEANTATALRGAGTTTTLLQGNHLVRDGSAWRVSHLEVVPCDCDFEHPSWSIHSTSGTVDPAAERATLWNSTVWVGRWPMPFYLPWLSLPLNDRQTGLLFPRPNNSSLSGFSWEQPVFVTLGRSADLTLTPGYFSGGTGPYGIQGPRLATEFRYTPSRVVEGRAAVGLLYDLRDRRDVVDPNLPDLDPATGLPRHVPRRLRWEASWNHVQSFGGGWGARVDANGYSDGNMLRDLVSDVLAREAGFLRSSAAVFRRGDDSYLGLDVTLRQDVQLGYPLFTRPTRLPGSVAPVFGPNPMQRLPSLQVAIPAKPLWGPLAFDLRASFTRIAPTWGQTGDEGPLANEGRMVDPVTGADLTVQCVRERLYLPTSFLSPGCGLSAAQKVGQGDRLWQPGEREARDRVDLFPRLAASVQPGGVLSVSGFAGWRQGAWLGEVTGRSSQRGYPVLGARAESSVIRVFPSAGLIHVVTPSVELRAVPVVLGTTPAPYDEIDLAVPDTNPRAQAQVELTNRLARKSSAEFLLLALGQGFELVAPALRAPRLNEAFARLTLGSGWVTASATARVDPSEGMSALSLTRASASLVVDDALGHGAWGAWENVLDDGTVRTRAPIDLLFGALLPPGAHTRSQLVSAGARWRYGPMSLRYDALILPHALPPAADGAVAEPLSLAQHTLTVGFSPACDCWRIDAYATQRPSPANLLVLPDFGLNFTVARFGSLGTPR